VAAELFFMEFRMLPVWLAPCHSSIFLLITTHLNNGILQQLPLPIIKIETKPKWKLQQQDRAR
jgi:hypothetical protein